ncbi:MAG: outer membrane beta-barrel protein [Pseudomonadota bacterium]
MDYKLILFGAAVAVGITTPAQAETEFKVSASIAAFNGEGATLPAATIRGTAFFTENFGVEGEGSFGIGQDEIEGIDIELDSAFARLPAGEQLSLHASLGYGTSRFSGSVDEVGSADVDVGGFSGGIGAEYNFTAKQGIRANDTHFNPMKRVSTADLTSFLSDRFHLPASVKRP